MSPTIYKLRYAFAFAKVLTPLPLWMHPLHFFQMMKLGSNALDAGDDVQAEGCSPEDAAEYEAWCWMQDSC